MQESNEKKLNNLLSKIGPSDEGAREKAHCHWAELAKPLGSLGVLEEDLEQISSLLGTDDFLLSPRKIFVLCADNGVVARGHGHCDRGACPAPHLGLPNGGGRRC